MNCPRRNGEHPEIIVSWAAGTLTPADELAFVEHIAACDSCRKMAAEQRALWSALDVWQPAAVSRDFDSRLYARISEDGKTVWWRRLLPGREAFAWGPRPAMPVAAVCALLLSVFLLKGPQPRQPAPVEAKNGVSIEQVERALDDMDMLTALAPVGGSHTQKM